MTFFLACEVITSQMTVKYYTIYGTLREIRIFYTSYSAFKYHLLIEIRKNSSNLITTISLNINITLA